MKRLSVTLLLCFCLTTPSLAAKHYNNDWRSMPFIEMMVTMMKVMNQVLGANNSFSGLSTLPYSPAFVPGMVNGMSGFGAMNRLPMSPGGLNSLPLNSFVNPLFDSFQPGQNISPYTKKNTHNKNSYNKSNSGSNFWDPNSTSQFYGDSYDQGQARNNNSVPMIDNNSLNGIWQALSGDVIAIYNDNRFLWSNGGDKNIAGHLAIKGNNMIAYVPAKNVTLYFQFYMEPGQFIVRDKTSRIYTFKRIH